MAVIQLPELASLLPYGDRPEPNEAQLAITALGLIALTAAYLYVAWNVARLSPAWAGLMFAYNAAIVVAKFILSPAALHNAPGTTLAQHVWVGMAVLLLYVAGLVTVYAVALRNRAPRRGRGRRRRSSSSGCWRSPWSAATSWPSPSAGPPPTTCVTSSSAPASGSRP